MATDPNFLDVVLLGKEFRIACPAGQYDALLASVGYLNGKLQEMVGGKRTPFSENLAVMAALNVTHEYLSLKNETEENAKKISEEGEMSTNGETIARRIRDLEASLDDALALQELATPRQSL